MSVNNFCILHLKSCQGLTNICFVIEIRSLASAKEDPNLYITLFPLLIILYYLFAWKLSLSKNIFLSYQTLKYDTDMLHVFSFKLKV